MRAVSSSGEFFFIPDEDDLSLLLLQPSGPVLVTQKDSTGATPLHYALQQRRLPALALLLAHGADAFEPDGAGNTALYHLAPLLPSRMPEPMDAARYFRDFVARGVTVDARNKRGETPLFTYVARGNIAVYEQRDWFVGLGADLGARDGAGQSLLHVLAARGPTGARRRLEREQVPEVGCFRYLMEKGVDAMLEDARQRTAVDVAAATGNEWILGMFRRAE